MASDQSILLPAVLDEIKQKLTLWSDRRLWAELNLRAGELEKTPVLMPAEGSSLPTTAFVKGQEALTQAASMWGADTEYARLWMHLYWRGLRAIQEKEYANQVARRK